MRNRKLKSLNLQEDAHWAGPGTHQTQCRTDPTCGMAIGRLKLLMKETPLGFSPDEGIVSPPSSPTMPQQARLARPRRDQDQQRLDRLQTGRPLNQINSSQQLDQCRAQEPLHLLDRKRQLRPLRFGETSSGFYWAGVQRILIVSEASLRSPVSHCCC